MPQNKKIKMHGIGDIVRSSAGRDRFRVFMVTGIDAENKLAPIVISDGKKHKLSEKKHKNPRHLRIINHYGEIHTKAEFNCLTDVQVSEICKKYDICPEKVKIHLTK